YLKMLHKIDAHSDDEYNPKRDMYIVKTLPFRSAKAGQFMQRVDDHMLKSKQLARRPDQKRTRLRPLCPQPSVFTKPPKGLPLDFYNVTWFNEALSNSQKQDIADIHLVMFLPDATHSLLGKAHPDEKLSDKKFTQKVLG
ncbi:hypothetical protein CROQUDRAFT_54133, partial [Cronartium quercuum f. sp. fusiforme G11]